MKKISIRNIELSVDNEEIYNWLEKAISYHFSKNKSLYQNDLDNIMQWIKDIELSIKKEDFIPEIIKLDLESFYEIYNFYHEKKIIIER